MKNVKNENPALFKKADDVGLLEKCDSAKLASVSAGKRIGILETNPDTAKQLVLVLTKQGYRVGLHSDVSQLKSKMNEGEYDVVLVDLLLPHCPLSSATSVEEFLSNNNANIPIVMISALADISTRLIALRAGIRAFITKPIDGSELLQKLADIIERRCDANTRVLVVDDDPVSTYYYDISLASEGFVVEAVNDPLAILDSIERFKPDIITLDYSMPGCNGLEIAELLRGDPRYMKIPILFISASEEALKLQGVIGIFGNAFLKKPVDTDELINMLKDIAAKTNKAKKAVIRHGNFREMKTYNEFIESLEAAREDELKSFKTVPQTFAALVCVDNYYPHLEERFESYLAEHRFVKGRICKMDENQYLALVFDKDGIGDVTLFSTFRQEFNRQQFIQRPMPESDTAFTLSIGAIPVGKDLPADPGEVFDILLHAQGKALDTGGNCVAWHDMRNESEKNKQTIVQALEASTFSLVFQPIINPESDEHLFEVQVRLVGSDEQIYTPEQFMPYLNEAIEDGGYNLDRWVIEHAFSTLENTHGRGSADYSITIKLSPDLKQIARLLPFIYNLMSNSRLKGVRRINFSITEEALLSDIDSAESIVRSIHKAGCGFMMEKCRANASTIETVLTLQNVDYIKLDSTAYLSGGHYTDNIKALQKAIGNGKLIAGLVEDAKTFARYWDLDIRFFQGYFFHHPTKNMFYEPIKSETLVLGN